MPSALCIVRSVYEDRRGVWVYLVPADGADDADGLMVLFPAGVVVPAGAVVQVLGLRPGGPYQAWLADGLRPLGSDLEKEVL